MQLGNTSEAIHHDEQLKVFGKPLAHPFPIMGNNTTAITLTKEARFHNLMKCFHLSKHLARVEQKTIPVKYIPTQDRIAYIMTKALPRPGFEKFRQAVGVVQLPL